MVRGKRDETEVFGRGLRDVRDGDGYEALVGVSVVDETGEVLLKTLVKPRGKFSI